MIILKALEIKNRYLLALLSVLLITLSSVSSYANAPYAPAESSCDPAYYSTLESRAWMEAQREITQNQNLIFKPDSVLEYSCFTEFLDNLERNGPTISDQSDVKIGVELNRLVRQPLGKYLTNNFNHTYLGGRMDEPEASDGCNVMNEVWYAAKCMGFIDDAETDGFYTFEHYRDNPDKRQLPPLPRACLRPTLGDGAGGGDRWTKEFKDSFEDVAWAKDPVKTFFDNLDADKCGSFEPFETGLTVYRTTDPKEYKEKVCTMPGCYYKPKKNGDDGECVAE